METITNTKSEGVALIKKHFGESAAKLYGESFADKSDSTVLLIVRELLTEYLGEEQAKSQMGPKLNSLYDQNANKK